MKNNKSLASTVVVLFVIVGLMQVGTLFFSFREIQELSNHNIEGAYSSIYEYQNRMRGIEVYAFLSNMIELAAYVAFLCWFYNAYANLKKAGINYVSHSNSYAVWAWIIPIMNLYKSFQLTKEVVDKSQNRIIELNQGYLPQNLNKSINTCWIVVVIHFVLSIGIFIWGMNKNTFEAGILIMQLGGVLNMVMIFITLLLAFIVYKVSKIEEHLFQVVNNS
ncbi:DUF4328 domain-containing protein [Myroides marinus]|uniref:DUF4328 domain-containing protein n=1 Tax=Myroides marinus TaxID=703342 RepID=UPI000742219B|nr:DUF4328 domain-containing protein [Myroides marinus]KUF43316.1 hypothetical protein AS361_10360 [Myroides marinus]MDM1349609.1 DUF4328 domain-containing protein [Myroides marinus]MDM1356818.1 DUF4328 domain-containing protein [Myroides marinus]MDM1361864.1 DUF4328 domain-containing protein [Myroides marinus]MDM1364392.1 DUF4328 domain-containing protein [Myroides marinus]